MHTHYQFVFVHIYKHVYVFTSYIIYFMQLLEIKSSTGDIGMCVLQPLSSAVCSLSVLQPQLTRVLTSLLLNPHITNTLLSSLDDGQLRNYIFLAKVQGTWVD